jgi:hypothetical protein
MQANSDFVAMLQCFTAKGVRFLVIGAYAVGTHSRPRATGDMDLWIARDPANARKVYAALADFGAPLRGIDATTFTEPEIVFQIGLPPTRIDILTDIDGIDFETAWPNRIAAVLGGVVVAVIGRDDLLRNKRASGRAKDLADVEMLIANADDRP